MATCANCYAVVTPGRAPFKRPDVLYSDGPNGRFCPAVNGEDHVAVLAVDRIVFSDDATVYPTDTGVRAIEKLIREGWSLPDAVAHIGPGGRS